MKTEIKMKESFKFISIGWIALILFETLPKLFSVNLSNEDGLGTTMGIVLAMLVLASPSILCLLASREKLNKQ